jgi:hypothetical protein
MDGKLTMRHAAKLQQFVEDLLARHQASRQEPQLRLQLREVEQLVISQTANRRQIRLSRHKVVRDIGQAKELEIVFFVNEEGQWIPYEYFRPSTRRQVCGVMDRRQQTLIVSNPLFQRGLVIQCDLWAARLRQEGWLEHGAKLDAEDAQLDGLFLWPMPTVEEPDNEQIEAWLIDDVCEATDGCLVEPDGTCPHGHPSWLRHLGLV